LKWGFAVVEIVVVVAALEPRVFLKQPLSTR